MTSNKSSHALPWQLRQIVKMRTQSGLHSLDTSFSQVIISVDISKQYMLLMITKEISGKIT